MNSPTIKITARQFGNIAAAAMANGYDVTTYLIRHALCLPENGATAPAPAPSPNKAPVSPAPAPSTTPSPAKAPAPAPAPAGTAGMFDHITD